MVTERDVRDVTDSDDDPESYVDLGLSTVVKRGNRRESLVAIRDKLAELLDDADDRTAPALALRLVAVIAEIDALPGGREVTKLDRLAAGVTDDLAARRAARVADAASS